jgi:hypothetical protein
VTPRCLVGLVALVACLASGRAAAAQDRPLVFVHGFSSNGTTWTDAATRLKVQLEVTTYAPGYNWKQEFSKQASELNGKLPGVAAPLFVVAHSNGGIAAREWSKTRAMSGLLTLSSPNQGAPISANAAALANYNVQIAMGLFNARNSFANPNEGSYWIFQVIQGALAFAADAYNLTGVALGSAGFDLFSDAFAQERIGSPYMQALNSPANVAREAGALNGNRAAIVTSVANYHLGGVFRAVDPANADIWRAGLYASIGMLDAYASQLVATGHPRDQERAQRLFYVSFLLALHEQMWCQAVSDWSPYAVSVAGSCYPNDTVIASWAQNMPGALAIPKPNMPEHVWQASLMTPVLYEVLTTHMGVAPRGGLSSQSELREGQQLTPGQQLVSPDRRYRLVYQGDGNLVIYRIADNLPIWSSGTYGTSPGRAVMQSDGNFVVYNAAGAPVFHTSTFGNAGAFLRLQNNASIVVLRGSDQVRLWGSPVPPWELNPTPTPPPGGGLDTLTAGARIYPGQAVTSLDRRFSLTYQTDGNLVLYGPGGARWSTQVFSSPGYAEMQVDGNFVVYASNGVPVWASGTSGVLNARLVVHNDGNVVIYSSSNVSVWATGTGGS